MTTADGEGEGRCKRRACAIVTLRADGRRWYGHGQAGKDAAHEGLKEDDTEPDRRVILSATGAAVQAEGWAPAYELMKGPKQ